MLFLYREALGIDLPWLDGVERAKKPARLPVVLTSEEVRATLAHLEGRYWLAASLLYGAGLRLMECLRLRVKDVDFARREIVVRSGKGGRDRVTMLPDSLAEALRAEVQRVAELHRQDVEGGFGWVWLPKALARKYPHAPRALAWQYLFAAAKLSHDPRSGRVGRHHLHEKSMQRAVKQAVRAAGLAKPASCHTFRHSFATRPRWYTPADPTAPQGHCR